MTLEDLTEKQWQKQVVQLAIQLGWKKAYHTFDSRRSQSGFPDLVLVRDRILYAEIKRMPRVASPLTATQREWLDALAAAGGETYLFRPSDLDEIARVLGKRWTYFMPGQGSGLGLLDRKYGSPNGVQEFWTPNALWLPGIGRADSQPAVEKGAA